MKKLDIDKIVNNKKLVGYGVGLSLFATNETTELPLSYLVDDNQNIIGKNVNGLPVHASDKLLTENKDEIFVIIFSYISKNFESISSRLNDMGFRYGDNYIDCSFFHYESISKKLKRFFNIKPNYDIFSKVRMLSLYTGVQNNSFSAGTWLYLEILNNISGKVVGDISECGVFSGENAFLSLLFLPKSFQNKTYHLFDSFEGFPELSTYDPPSRYNDFKSVNFINVKNKFSNFSNVIIHKGLFEETFDEVSSKEFCMVYIDCDLYKSTKLCCEFFYDRMPSGGTLFVHDYWLPSSDLLKLRNDTFTGVHKAVNEFIKYKEENIIVFPETTHALIVKK